MILSLTVSSDWYYRSHFYCVILISIYLVSLVFHIISLCFSTWLVLYPIFSYLLEQYVNIVSQADFLHTAFCLKHVYF